VEGVHERGCRIRDAVDIIELGLVGAMLRLGYTYSDIAQLMSGWTCYPWTRSRVAGIRDRYFKDDYLKRTTGRPRYDETAQRRREIERMLG